MPLVLAPMLLPLTTLMGGRQVYVRPRRPDLHVGASVAGIVRKVGDDGSLLVKRTADGRGAEVRVDLWGVVLPKKGRYRTEAISFLRERLTGKEVRFTIHGIKGGRLSSAVSATDLKEGWPINSYLVYLGLANTDQSGFYEFTTGLKHAQSNRLGIWRASR